MPLRECARAPLGGGLVGRLPDGPGGVHELCVTVRDGVRPVVRCDVHRAAQLHASVRASRSRALPADAQGGLP
ncbi:Uncharacterised protein [Mycobacteroides abscessus subsp. abscessus]|nr:Uncharacterised protein [Mycobacteroides abscessus subsp. abscessus]SKT84651.1 Uncharacterised protein [Mycobacteroides abscessus subsp. abscessus]